MGIGRMEYGRDDDQSSVDVTAADDAASSSAESGSAPSHSDSANPASVKDKPQLLVSSGMICLCVVAGHHQRSADPAQLSRTLGFDASSKTSNSQLLLAARELGLKAKVVHSNWDRLSRLTLPAILEYAEGDYRLLLRRDPDG